MLEGHVEGRHDACPQFGLGHEVVLGVVELEVNHLVYDAGIGFAQVVERVKGIAVVLQFAAPYLWRNKINVVLAFVLASSEWLG